MRVSSVVVFPQITTYVPFVLFLKTSLDTQPKAGLELQSSCPSLWSAVITSVHHTWLCSFSMYEMSHDKDIKKQYKSELST